MAEVYTFLYRTNKKDWLISLKAQWWVGPSLQTPNGFKVRFGTNRRKMKLVRWAVRMFVQITKESTTYRTPNINRKPHDWTSWLLLLHLWIPVAPAKTGAGGGTPLSQLERVQMISITPNNWQKCPGHVITVGFSRTRVRLCLSQKT